MEEEVVVEAGYMPPKANAYKPTNDLYAQRITGMTTAQLADEIEKIAQEQVAYGKIADASVKMAHAAKQRGDFNSYQQYMLKENQFKEQQRTNDSYLAQIDREIAKQRQAEADAASEPT